MDLHKALPNYLDILEGKRKPRFKQLGKELDNKIRKAFSMLKRCELCERRCKVDRTKAQQGFCRLGDKMIVASMFDHLGEEPFFVPSFTVFFWSCTFSCQFCQNWTISQRIEPGTEMKEEKLARAIDGHSYCKNVNFVGGEPTPQLPFILKTLKHVKIGMPVVWNSNFYMSTASMRLLRKVVDVYLPDFKYGNDNCALRLSKVPNYWEVTTRNHLLAAKDSEMVVRHLLLPNHFECCTKPVLEWIAENLGGKVLVNIMDQYRPCYKAAEYAEINRTITREELDQAVRLAKKLGLNFMT